MFQEHQPIPLSQQDNRFLHKFKVLSCHSIEFDLIIYILNVVQEVAFIGIVMDVHVLASFPMASRNDKQTEGVFPFAVLTRSIVIMNLVQQICEGGIDEFKVTGPIDRPRRALTILPFVPERLCFCFGYHRVSSGWHWS
jgi:hypothetical protein